MGVYIKGMTPEQFWEGEKPKLWDIIEVEEPHGDLVDIDELRKVMGVSDLCETCPQNSKRFGCKDEDKRDICHILDDAEAIIDAEGSN